MPKSRWFDALSVVNQEEAHSWLAGIPKPINRIANFGCWAGSEPLALLWTLGANEITVVEIEQKFLGELDEQISILEARFPESLKGLVIRRLCRDMTIFIPELSDSYYDLVYTRDTLYALPYQGGEQALGRALDQTFRILKPGGFLVVVEPKFGATFETRESGFPGIPITVPIPISEPQDMSPIFMSKGFQRYDLQDCPPYAYCFAKPQGQ